MDEAFHDFEAGQALAISLLGDAAEDPARRCEPTGCLDPDDVNRRPQSQETLTRENQVETDWGSGGGVSMASYLF